MPAAKFQIPVAASAGKRPSEPLPSPKRFKVPCASSVTLLEVPKLPQAARSLPETAPVLVVMYKVSDCAGDLWDQFNGQDVALWQVQMDHPVRTSSICYQIRDAFGHYLEAESEENETLPKTLQDLASKAGVRLVVTDAKDPDDIGFIQWRPAFYVAADDLTNFLHLLDGFFLFKEQQMVKREQQPFEVHLHPHSNVDIAEILDQLEYGNYTLQEPADNLPLGVFEAQGLKKPITLNFQVQSPEKLSIVVTGGTWPFKERFDAFGIRGARAGDDGEDNKQYIRVLLDLDVSEQSSRDRVLGMIGDNVLKNLALRATVDKEPEKDSAVEAFIETLKLLPSLHFGAKDKDKESKVNKKEKEAENVVGVSLPAALVQGQPGSSGAAVAEKATVGAPKHPPPPPPPPLVRSARLCANV